MTDNFTDRYRQVRDSIYRKSAARPRVDHNGKPIAGEDNPEQPPTSPPTAA